MIPRARCATVKIGIATIAVAVTATISVMNPLTTTTTPTIAITIITITTSMILRPPTTVTAIVTAMFVFVCVDSVMFFFMLTFISAGHQVFGEGLCHARVCRVHSPVQQGGQLGGEGGGTGLGGSMGASVWDPGGVRGGVRGGMGGGMGVSVLMGGDTPPRAAVRRTGPSGGRSV